MWIRRLQLTSFRNYREQTLDLHQGPVLLLGDNAQGKSNLLEAVLLLATTRSERAQTDAELICWDTLDGPQPFARVSAQVERGEGPVELDVIIAGGAVRGRASKRLRVNGVPRRQGDMVGQLTAVLFSTHDLDLIAGSPSGRRRFIDVTLSQLDAVYVRALQRYTKLIAQRNALLRRIQEGVASADELDVWDGSLAEDGAVLIQRRASAIESLAQRAREAHTRLSGGKEELSILYQPRLEGWERSDSLAAALYGALASGRQRDIGAGVTLTGPHRDDLAFSLNGASIASFASRGQQRTAAISLRLAEARYMADQRGDLPVVLLDDVLSELDEGRRRPVVESLGEWDQLLITSADPDRFGEGMPEASAVFRVISGTITPLS